jgi:hypothetical protein
MCHTCYICVTLQRFNLESLELLGKMLERSGLGNNSCSESRMSLQ